ncbi:MAG: class I SAM-dependent methyltransferase [Deltaproteobacteria bacterium]|nr:class I SAM-dependent methyltransferase [Deltaproteobacteria bacterium]
MYDRSASRWHASISRLGYLTAYTNLFERLVIDRQLPVFDRQARVLDAGIGSGALSLALAETVGARFQLDGVDLAPRMLQEAQLRLNTAGVSATLHQRRIEALPFAADRFDAVLSSHALEHVTDLSAAIGELVRVLRPGAPMMLVLSRPGPATAWLRLRWGAATYMTGVILGAMGDAGLVEHRLYPFTSGIAQHWSCAYVGRKVHGERLRVSLGAWSRQ